MALAAHGLKSYTVELKAVDDSNREEGDAQIYVRGRHGWFI